MAYKQFADRARRVMRLTDQEARRLNCEYLNSSTRILVRSYREAVTLRSPGYWIGSRLR